MGSFQAKGGLGSSSGSPPGSRRFWAVGDTTCVYFLGSELPCVKESALGDNTFQGCRTRVILLTASMAENMVVCLGDFDSVDTTVKEDPSQGGVRGSSP